MAPGSETWSYCRAAANRYDSLIASRSLPAQCIQSLVFRLAHSKSHVMFILGSDGCFFIQRWSMTFRRTALLSANLLLFFTGQDAAQDQAVQDQGVLGHGNVSCTSWLESRKGSDVQVAARMAWVLGYITAFNQYGYKPQGDVSGGKDTEDMAAWIDAYCIQYPAANVYRASAALVDELRAKAGR